MRIIAGTKARMTILPPRDRTTRPITDRVKESLFSILGSYIADTVVADLFCGTGSLGLEALSRGARHAVMVDTDRDALMRLRKNIEKLRFQDSTSVVSADIFQTGIPSQFNYNSVSPRDKPELCNLVFVDPPYRLSQNTSLESQLGRLLIKISAQIADEATIIFRHERRTEPLLSYADLHQFDQRIYGRMGLTFLEKTGKIEKDEK